MTGPRRLLDESLDDLELSLLRSWRQSTPAPGATERAAAALGVAAAMTAPPATVGAAAAGMTAKAAASAQVSLAVLAKWCAVGVASGAVALGSGHAVTGLFRADSGPADRSIQAATAMPHRPQPSRSGSFSIKLPTEPPPTIPEESHPAAVGVGRRASTPLGAAPTRRLGTQSTVPPPALPTSRSIGWEIAMLDQARRALADRDVGQALQLLDQFDRGGSTQTFGPEAMLLRIDALSAAGRSAEAGALARHYLQRHPSSPGSERLRALVASP